MRKFILSLAVVAGMFAATPAVADDSNITVYGASKECWDNGKTLWHVTVFNNSNARQKVVYTYTLNRANGTAKTVSSVTTLGKQRGSYLNAFVKPNQYVTNATVTYNGVTIFFRPMMKAVPRCYK